MIRIVHTADLHIGADTVGPMNSEYRIPDRVLDFFDSLDAIIEYSEEHDADLAIIAGDSFHRNPNPVYLSMFAERLSRLSKKCLVVLLVGNHDISGTTERASYVDVFSAIDIPNVIVAKKFSVHRLNINGNSLCVATMPYPNKSRILSAKETRGKSSDEVRDVYKKKISKIISLLEKKVSDPAILVGHFTISGAIGVGDMAMIGDDAEVSLEDVARPIWRYIAMGHIHGFQDLTASSNDLPPVVYPGSIERVSFNEEKQAKGFVWVEIDEGTSYEFIELDARKYKTVEIDVPENDRNYTNYILSKLRKYDLSKKVVRVLINLEEDRKLRMPDIYDAISDAYAISAVNVKVKRPEPRVRLDLDAPIASYNNAQLLEMYFESKDVTGKRLKQLMRLGRDIMEEVDSERLQ